MKSSSTSTLKSKARYQLMINFVLQEAREKCDEIALKTEYDFITEKEKSLIPELKKLNIEYNNKCKEIDIKRKIEKSTQHNKARLKLLETRNDLMEKLEKESIKKLSDVKNNKNSYTKIISDLIVQSLIRINEKKIVIKCTKSDVDIVKSTVNKSVKQYSRNK